MKPIKWIGSSLRDLKEFPEQVQKNIGYALHFAELGLKHDDAKPLKGIGGGVMEIVADYDSDTYRAVYTVKIKEVIYVIHAFQKKSKKGIKTPQHEIDLIKRRLKDLQKQIREEMI